MANKKYRKPTPTAEPDVQHKEGKAKPAPSLTHDLPPSPRERKDARRKAALEEAEKSWADRRARAKPNGGIPG